MVVAVRDDPESVPGSFCYTDLITSNNFWEVK